MKFSKFNLFVNDSELPENRFILCNTLSGEFFLVDDRLKQNFESGDLGFISEEQIPLFVKSGVLVEDADLDETLFLSYAHNLEKYSNRVLNLTILLTMACNLRCVYCYEGAGIVSSESLTDEVRASIFSFVKNQIKYRKSDNVSICLFGGEPLFGFQNNVGFLRQIQALCKEDDLGFSTSIVTNGVLVNRKNLDLLVELNCNYVQITLDGIKDFHDKRRITPNGGGSFEETLRGIKTVVAEQRLSNPVIRINIDKTNVENAYELLDYLKKEELDCCAIDFGIVKGTTAACASYSGNCFLEEELGEILFPLWEKVKALGFSGGDDTKPFRRNAFCGLYGDSAFTIAPNGDLYKCWDHVNDNVHKMGKIGKDGEFLDVTKAYFKWMNRNPYYIKECRECVYLPTCGGGCAAISYNNTNDYNSPGCHKVKTVFEKQIISRYKNLHKK